MSKKIIHAGEMLEIARETVNEVANIVAETLGPAGKPILLQREGNEFDGTPLKPHSTKDGVTVAKGINYRDPAKETICRRIIEASSNTVNNAGDGTTTTMVLLQSIFNEGMKSLEKETNSSKLYNDLNIVADEVLAEIDKVKIPVTLESIYEVALIACNGDTEVAKVVADAMTFTGEHGYCKVEDGSSRETTIEMVEGATYTTGWSSFGPHGYWLVNNKAAKRADLEAPSVVLFDGKLESVPDLEHILKIANPQTNQTMTPLFIMCREVNDDVREAILRLRSANKYPIACIKIISDGTPESKTGMLEDLAVMTGTTICAKGIQEIKDLTTQTLGRAERIEISRQEVVIFTDDYYAEDVEERVEELTEQLNLAVNEYDKEHVRLRMAKLSSSLAVIRVGGSSEAEVMEKKDRVEDALCSAKAAIQDGICPGGGYTLYKIAQNMKDTTLAHKIMKKALQAPIKRIIINAGESPDAVLATLPRNKGYDALNKKSVDLMKSGIIDAVKVVKNAVRNSTSVGGTLLIGGGCIVSDQGSQDGMANPLAALAGLGGGQ